MAIQARAYANKKGKAEGVNNRISIGMSVEDAVALYKGRSSATEALHDALGEIDEVTSAKAPKKKRSKKGAE